MSRVFYWWENGQLTIVTMYVDDLILMADLMDCLLNIKASLASTFRMKDLGPLNFILGISVRQTDGQIQLHQKQYILNMLARFDMLDAYPVYTPSDTSVHLVKDDRVSGKADKKLFQQIMGSLQYAVSGTRPDIAHAVNKVARYSNDPSEVHLTAAKRILQYLKGTQDMAITYVKGEIDELLRYSNADWAGDKDSCRSTSGHLFLP